MCNNKPHLQESYQTFHIFQQGESSSQVCLVFITTTDKLNVNRMFPRQMSCRPLPLVTDLEKKKQCKVFFVCVPDNNGTFVMPWAVNHSGRIAFLGFRWAWLSADRDSKCNVMTWASVVRQSVKRIISQTIRQIISTDLFFSKFHFSKFHFLNFNQILFFVTRGEKRLRYSYHPKTPKIYDKPFGNWGILTI